MIRCCLYPYLKRCATDLQAFTGNRQNLQQWQRKAMENHCVNQSWGRWLWKCLSWGERKEYSFLLRWFRWLVQFTICEVDYWKVFGNREVHGPKLLTSPIPPNPHCSRDALVQEPEDITHMRDPPKHRPTLGHGCNTNTKIQICILYTQKHI